MAAASTTASRMLRMIWDCRLRNLGGEVMEAGTGRGKGDEKRYAEFIIA